MNSPVVVIVGPTASGKSLLAIEMAKIFNGEIICADSRTIYKGMDIGTAKPSEEERAQVPHHLLDILRPNESMTVADFTTLAKDKIAELSNKGKLPIVVGGSGLYVDALVYDFDFAPKGNDDERQKLQALSVSELQKILVKRGISLPFNKNNPRHLIRHIETYGQMGKRHELRPNTLVLGLSVDNDYLKQYIIDRTNRMFGIGLEAEVRGLVAEYGWDNVLSLTIGYQEFKPYFNGQGTMDDVKRAIIGNTNKLAKRQKTWFKRSGEIHWINKVDKSEALVTTFLNT